MELTDRQKTIIEIVKTQEPISGDNIAKQLNLSRATLRNDLSILTMTGILDARPKAGYFYSGQTVEPLLFEKLYKTSIASLTIPPVTVKQNVSIYEAVTTLFVYDVGSLYVIDENDTLIGVISRKDLLRATISNNQITTTPVAVIMTRKPNIVTTTTDTRILDVGYLLMQHQVDSLPVIDSEQKVIGKITKTIIMNYFVKSGLAIEENQTL